MTNVALLMLSVGFILHIIGEDIRDLKVKGFGTALGFSCLFTLFMQWVGIFG